jgi:hypothetical protein
MNTNNPEEGGWLILLYVPAWIVGSVIGWYCGATLLFPAVGIGIVLAACKIRPIPRLQPFAGALAAQAGLAFFMLAGGIAHPDQISVVIYDVAALAVGLVWLVTRPGLLPVLLLGIYQVYALVINVGRFSTYEPGSLPHKAIVATIALRVAAVIALIVGYVKFRKKEAESKQSLPPTTLEPTATAPSVSDKP